MLLSARRSYIQLEANEAHQLSPARHVSALDYPVTVAVGDRESPEFQRHARALRDGLDALGRLGNWIEERDCDHFEIWERLADPATALGGAAIRLALGKPA
ncbi:hypothetical protein ACE7GA_02395 [Roseomonas sp. CCTCC AB2023176]|uniref:hypothetical protein n=1 Tax=Roseomonas sp. CCTCC AB2023176 TaxID=3342640 RepID=UPI0035DE6F6E